MTTNLTRIPEVKTLYDTLPKGAEGGKEFGRIVDLLLYYAARREGRTVTIFSDVAGDYKGLDSFEIEQFRSEGTIGYQYKFFSSPLTNQNRNEIKESLHKALAGRSKSKLSKWVLVTPTDLVESGTRKTGGDIS